MIIAPIKPGDTVAVLRRVGPKEDAEWKAVCLTTVKRITQTKVLTDAGKFRREGLPGYCVSNDPKHINALSQKGAIAYARKTSYREPPTYQLGSKVKLKKR